MSVKENLELLKNKVEADVPALIADAELTSLDEYVFGGPTDSENLSLGFYLGPGDEDPEMIRFKPVMQLQLKGIQYVDGLKYFDILSDYLDGLDPVNVGMVNTERISYTEYPPDETGTTFFIFYIEYNKERDDCD
jgi:hypothetical protein